MPFFIRRMKKISDVRTKCTKKVQALFGMLSLSLIMLGMTACTDPGQEDVFWMEEMESVQETAVTDEEFLEEETKELTGGPKEQALFVVHICGAVKVPGVYELSSDSRIMDAVEAAGGFAEDAAQDARNLAERITDGSRIRIPTVLEAQEEQNARTEAEDRQNVELTNDNLVNINTADAVLLQTLPGIGESRAAAIIEYRRKYGAFGSIEDIMKVSGIKQSAFDKLKDRITV